MTSPTKDVFLCVYRGYFRPAYTDRLGGVRQSLSERWRHPIFSLHVLCLPTLRYDWKQLFGVHHCSGWLLYNLPHPIGPIHRRKTNDAGARNSLNPGRRRRRRLNLSRSRRRGGTHSATFPNEIRLRGIGGSSTPPTSSKHLSSTSSSLFQEI